MKNEYKADCVDVITEQGPNKILSEKRFGFDSQSIKKRVEISVEVHASKIVTISGHFDCVGNPAEKEIQIKQIKEAVETIKSWGFNLQVIGLCIDDHWKVHKIV